MKLTYFLFLLNSQRNDLAMFGEDITKIRVIVAVTFFCAGTLRNVLQALVVNLAVPGKRTILVNVNNWVLSFFLFAYPVFVFLELSAFCQHCKKSLCFKVACYHYLRVFSTQTNPLKAGPPP